MCEKKEQWECKKCGNINNNWIVDFAKLMKTGIRIYKKGPCENCIKIEKEKDYRRQKQIESLKAAQKAKELFVASELPPKIMNKIDDLQINKGAEKAFLTLNRIENADRWIYIHGTNNTGKSCLIGATVMRLSKKGIPSYYFNERSLFERIKRNNFKNKERDIVFNAISHSKIVFYDDFSVFPWSEWEEALIFDIINDIDYRGTTLVITSNIDYFSWLKEDINFLQNRLGKRLMARLTRNKLYEIKMSNKPFFT